LAGENGNGSEAGPHGSVGAGSVGNGSSASGDGADRNGAGRIAVTSSPSQGGAETALRRSPDIFFQIAEQSLLVAERLRHTYLERTLALADALRRLAKQETEELELLQLPGDAPEPTSVAFVDGGVGQVNLNVSMPVIVRAGLFRVREGEADLDEREFFAHFPLLLGELDGGLKTDRDYASVVRMLVEAMALRHVLTAPELEDVRVIMLHGPLVYLADPLFHHTFPASDYLRILGSVHEAEDCLGEFQEWCRNCRWANQAKCRESRDRDRMPAMCLLAFLLRDGLDRCRDQGRLICGVVERSSGRSLLRRILRLLIEREDPAVVAFLDSHRNGAGTQSLVDDLLEVTRFSDSMLLSLVLDPGSCTMPGELTHRRGDERGGLFPPVLSTYVKPRRSRPYRVEFPTWLAPERQLELLNRVYAYADLLPGYAFPLGLDIVDKYTRVPGWMTHAFETQIKLEYGRLLGGRRPDLDRIADHLFFGHDRGDKPRPEVR